MKTLKVLTEIKVLTKREQKLITGGYACVDNTTCPPGSYCCHPNEDVYICRPNGRACY